MKATKTMIKNEFDRRVGLLEEGIRRLKSEQHRFFDKQADHEVWARLLDNAFNQIDLRLEELKFLASEWEDADDSRLTVGNRF